MIRVAKLTDYGISLMARFARCEPGASHTARDLAGELGIPQPTVSKLLKILARCELLDSQRGAKGGYSLSRAADSITLAELVGALEGPVAMTECAVDEREACGCGLEETCEVKDNWSWINRQVMSALESVSLSQMAGSLSESVDHKPGGP